MYNWIFLGAIFLIAGISVLVGALKAKKYVWQFTLAKTITVIVSIVLSVILSVVLARTLADLAVSYIPAIISDDSVAMILAEVPSAGASIAAIITMLISPILFMFLFGIVEAIIGLFKKPLARLILWKKKDKENKKQEFLTKEKFDGASAICGAICSLLVFIASAAPIIGFVGIANSAMPIVSSISNVDTQVVEIVNSAAENPGTKTVKALGGDLIFNSLTKTKINDEKVKLSTELDCALSVANAYVCVYNDDVSNADKANAIRQTAPAFEKSTIVPTVASEFLSGATAKWSKGEDFCYISAPSLGADFDSATNALYTSFASTTSATIREDYKSITNIFALVVERDVLDQMSDGNNNVLLIFKDEELVSGIMVEMLNNERLSPAIEGFANAGMTMIARSLGIYENPQALYDGFIADMSDEYKEIMSGSLSNTEKFNELSAAIDEIYIKYGIDLSNGVAECIAISMLDDETLDDVQSFEQFFGAISADPEPASANGVYRVTMLTTAANTNAIPTPNATKIVEKAALLAVNSDSEEALAESISELLVANSKFFNDLTEEEQAEVKQNISTKLYEEKESEEGIKFEAASFTDAEKFSEVSVVVTADKLNISMSNITSTESESKALAKVFASAVDIVDKVSESEGDMVSVISSFGTVLDSFSECESIGTEGTSNLVTAIMQSEKVQTSVGFTVLQATEVANVINEQVTTNDTDNYTSVLESVGQTVEIIQSTSNGETSTESIKDLINTITPTTAKALKKLATPDTLKNYGVPEANAKQVSEILGDIMGQMADAKEKGMSDEQYEREADAISDMFNIAMSVSESNNKSGTVFGEDSTTGVTAEEYVDRVMNSEVISNTLKNTTHDKKTGELIINPLKMGALAESDKAELVAAIDASWKSSDKSNDNKEILTSIGAILGVELEFSSDAVIAK